MLLNDACNDVFGGPKKKFKSFRFQMIYSTLPQTDTIRHSAGPYASNELDQVRCALS